MAVFFVAGFPCVGADFFLAAFVAGAVVTAALSAAFEVVAVGLSLVIKAAPDQLNRSRQFQAYNTREYQANAE